MKKKIIIITVVFILITTTIFAYKKWQNNGFGLINPQIETIESISEFKSQLNLPGVLVHPKNKGSFEYLNQFFRPGDIWVFNGDGKIIDVNFENKGGSCYSDIIKNIENNYNFSKTKISDEFSSQNFLDSLRIKTENKNANLIINQKDYDYIIVYGWAKYLKASYDNNGLVDRLGKLTNGKKRVLVISSNIDFMNYIFKTQEELPKFIE